MRPITVTVGPLAAASANNIALSQTPAAAGPLILNGSLVGGPGETGDAVLDTPRRILITTADSTHLFTITGVSPTDAALTEVIAANGTSVYSTLDYAEVTSITINGAATAAVTVGTNGIASTPWARLDEWASPAVAIQCDVTGTVNYTIQSTLDDPNSATNPVLPSAVNWIATSDAAGVGATGSIQTNFAYAPTFVRCLLNSGSGSVVMTVVQMSAVPY
jgi:hypothetical protein